MNNSVDLNPSKIDDSQALELHPSKMDDDYELHPSKMESPSMDDMAVSAYPQKSDPTLAKSWSGLHTDDDIQAAVASYLAEEAHNLKV